jgi:hypothetical protein
MPTCGPTKLRMTCLPQRRPNQWKRGPRRALNQTLGVCRRWACERPWVKVSAAYDARGSPVVLSGGRGPTFMTEPNRAPRINGSTGAGGLVSPSSISAKYKTCIFCLSLSLVLFHLVLMTNPSRVRTSPGIKDARPPLFLHTCRPSFLQTLLTVISPDDPLQVISTPLSLDINMSSQTPEQIRQLEEQTKNFSPDAAFRPPRAFLSLAPTVSTSYPKTQKPKPSAKSSIVSTDAPTEASPDLAGELDASKRRTSSLGSDGNSPTIRRFLKLGPTHFGQHQGDHQEDYHDVAVE